MGLETSQAALNRPQGAHNRQGDAPSTQPIERGFAFDPSLEPSTDHAPMAVRVSDMKNFSLAREIAFENTQIVSQQQGLSVVLTADLLVVDADETKLANTLEELHDGTKARFARGSILASNLKGVEISEADLNHDDFWSETRKALSGLTEEGWLKGICERMFSKFNVQLEPEHLAQCIESVLKSDKDDFCSRIGPVERIEQLINSFAHREVLLGLCTTTNENIISPFLKHFELLRRYDERLMAFGVDKKVKDPTEPNRLRFNGEGVARIAATAEVPLNRTVMLGDSVADFGTAAMAGCKFVVLRAPDYLVQQYGAEEAKNRLARVVEAARNDNIDVPGFADAQVIIVDDYEQVRILGRRSGGEWKNGHLRSATAWVGTFSQAS